MNIFKSIFITIAMVLGTLIILTSIYKRTMPKGLIEWFILGTDLIIIVLSFIG